MATKKIREYFTQDLNIIEHESYINYINGDDSSTKWIEKALIRREPLLNSGLKCVLCNEYIDIKPNGICRCKNGHRCYNIVFNFLKQIQY